MQREMRGGGGGGGRRKNKKQKKKTKKTKEILCNEKDQKIRGQKNET